MSININKLELKITQKLKKYQLGDILYSLHCLYKKTDIPPFIIAGVAQFAIRFSPPSKVTQCLNVVKDIQSIVQLISTYLLADPVTFDRQLHDEFIHSNPVFLILRLVCQQFPFDVSKFSQYTRPIILYQDIPKKLAGKKVIPQFDIIKELEKLNKVSLEDFIKIGFVVSCAAQNNFTFSLEYFKNFQAKGINLSDVKAISKVVNQLTIDRRNFIKLYEKRKNSDRRFRMYDFNPLLQYPIVLPCSGTGFGNNQKVFMCAPVPSLIDERMSIGIYYQLFNQFNDKFTNYFGHVLEEYLGTLLEHSITSEKILKESDIRQCYKGKAPDYAIIDGKTALLFECKATKFNLTAKTQATEEAINNSLKQVLKGFKQLDDFIKACQSKLPELADFHQCEHFEPILISLEPLYLINSEFFREHINQLLRPKGVTNLNWQILSIGELEALQPHLSEGIHFSQVLNNLRQKTFKELLQKLYNKTGKTYKDSFLYPQQEELYQRLGLPDKNDEKKK